MYICDRGAAKGGSPPLRQRFPTLTNQSRFCGCRTWVSVSLHRAKPETHNPEPSTKWLMVAERDHCISLSRRRSRRRSSRHPHEARGAKCTRKARQEKRVVLVYSDVLQDCSFVDMLWQWQLHQDTMYLTQSPRDHDKKITMPAHLTERPWGRR